MSRDPSTGAVQADDFRQALGRVGAWIDAYYDDPLRYPVLSRARPGDLVAALPAQPPLDGEPFERIFADFERFKRQMSANASSPRPGASL